MIFNIFEFIYNNLFVVSIIVLSILLAGLLGRKWYEEVKINKRLNVKKTMLRSLKNVTFKLPSMKRTLRVFVPIVFLGLFFLLSFSVPKDYTNHLKRVDNEETFMSIYTTFNERFYSTPLQNSDALSDRESQDAEPIGSKKVIEGLDFVAQDEERVYIANDSGIKVISEGEDTFKIENSLPYPSIQDTCETKTFDIKGIAIEGNKLVSVSYFSQTNCQENKGLVFDGPNTIIRVYDTDKDFELADEYIIAGHLDQGLYKNGNLVVASNAYLPSNPDKEMLESYFPHVTHNDEREIASLSDLRYIENTNPNTLLSLSLIDIQSGHYDFETTLTDYKYLLEMDENNVYLSTNAYQFDTSSEVFEMQNPIESIHTIISKFSLRDDEIYFSKTRQFSDRVTPFDGFILKDEKLFVLFESEDGHRLQWFDSQVDAVDSILLNNLKDYERLQFVNGSLFLYQGSNHTPIEEIQVTNNQLIPLNTIDYDKASTTGMYELASTDTSVAVSKTSYSLSVDLVSSSHTVLDSYNLDLAEYNISTPLTIYDTEAMNQNARKHTFYLPLLALEEDSNYLYKHMVVVLSIRDEREFIVEPVVELKNIENPMSPFTYRYLVVGDEDYHITPGGIFVTNESAPGEVIRKFSFN